MEMGGLMLRSHHLCCMAIYIDKTCEVRSSEIRSVCLGGTPETHRPDLQAVYCHLCCMAIYIDKTCEVRSSEIRSVCLGGTPATH